MRAECFAVDQQRAVAKGPLAQGEPFLALPLSKCWTADTAKACSKLSSYLDADAPDSTWLALHLLLLKQEQGNALQKQLQLLDDSAGLLRWDDTELALLQGSPWMLVAGQGREEIQAEYEELLGSGSNLEELGVTLSGYLWAQASLERCLLRFLSKDGNPVEIFMPALVLLEAGSDCSLPETAADCARLEFLDGQEPVLVFYAPRGISAGDPVPLCHGGLAGGSGRLLLQRGRVWP